MISMKKSPIAFIAAIMLTATWAWAEPVSLKTAETVAQNWLTQRTASPSETYKVCETFTVQEKSRTAYYVFAFTPKGWVIVSADDGVRPVIAYSTEGVYSPANHPAAFDTWMDGVKQVITTLPVEKTPVSPQTTEEWLRLTRNPEDLVESQSARLAAQSVNPLIQTTWGQNSPYNLQCPVDEAAEDGHAVTGCVATAMTQIMKYYAYPQTGYGTHSYVLENHPEYGTLSADFGSATYDFWLIRLFNGSIQDIVVSLYLAREPSDIIIGC